LKLNNIGLQRLDIKCFASLAINSGNIQSQYDVSLQNFPPDFFLLL